jgi:hypothetical protein
MTANGHYTQDDLRAKLAEEQAAFDAALVEVKGWQDQIAAFQAKINDKVDELNQRRGRIGLLESLTEPVGVAD